MNKNKLLDTIGNVAPVLIFLFLVFLFYPYREVFQADSDEGVNLMKAFMLHKGYVLYSDIWSDQPPILTIAIRVLIDLFGTRVWLIRTFILLISALMFFVSYQILRLRWAPIYGLVGAVLLFLHPSYVKLSTSIMVGLPSIAFVFVALYFLHFWHRNRSSPALILSAIAMTISIGIKLFTGFMGVIIVIGLVISEYNHADRRAGIRWLQILTPAFIWGIVFTIGTLFVAAFLVGFENLPQLIRSHLDGVEIELYQKEVYTINYHLITQVPIFFLALIGTYLSVRKRNWFFLYFAAWSLTAYLLLLNHSPVWYHQKILVSAPAAILAAVAVGFFVDHIRLLVAEQQSAGILVLILIGMILMFFDFRLPGFLQQFRMPPEGISQTFNTQEEILFNRIRDAKPETTWGLTDQPMYAFRNGLPVPPKLAAFTMKRFYSGELTELELIEAIHEYNPEQILLGRTEYPEVYLALAEDYVLIEQFGTRVKYYLRSDIASLVP
jgi:hypothetical protein